MRETLAASTLGGAGPAAGGIAGVGPAAVSVASPTNFAGFDMLGQGYQDYLALPDASARRAFLVDRKSYRPVVGVPPLGQGPGDIAVFAAMHEMTCKLNHMLFVGCYYDTQEDLGISCILSVFTEDVVAIARTAIDDAPASGQAHYRLHSALSALTGVPLGCV